MNLIEFINDRYKKRKDKSNMFGVGVSDAEFRQFIIDYLLGEKQYVVDPIGQAQINEIALYEILKNIPNDTKKNVNVSVNVSKKTKKMHSLMVMHFLFQLKNPYSFYKK